jgi:ribonucleotide monophosphatase NagD (HAD superfamily)
MKQHEFIQECMVVSAPNKAGEHFLKRFKRKRIAYVTLTNNRQEEER